MPYWKLTGDLEDLSFEFALAHLWNLVEDRAECEFSEAEYALFEIPDVLPTSFWVEDDGIFRRDDIDAMHYRVISRAIIAAARGGRLKRLNMQAMGSTHMDVQPPFAIRTLLPFWIVIEEWSPRVVPRRRGWVLAASTLRPLLTHASLWYAAPSLRGDRLLMRQDVQGLQAELERTGVPHLAQLHVNKLTKPDTVKRYLPWLAESEELSQQVADAWNAVVKRGEADKLSCCCGKCAKKLQKK